MSPPDSKNSSTILIVDDEPSVLVGLRSVLERQQFHVVATTSTERALRELTQRTFGVVISDQNMPEMTGLEFLKKVREVQPDASRVLITAAIDLPTLVDAINEGEIYRFIAKPWLREELLATLGNAKSRHELVVQNRQLLEQTTELNEQISEANTVLAAQVVQLESQREQLAAKNIELKQRYDLSLELSSRILATYDSMLAGQTKAIAALTEQMLSSQHFTTEERESLQTSAWLCDLGLIGVPRDLYRSFIDHPAQLSERDLASIHSHPTYSQTLTAHVDGRPLVGQTVRSHHEKFDGSGYPDGLAGSEIPWAARCLAVAVLFVESRLSTDQALALIDKESGHALDPEAVRLFRQTTNLRALPRSVSEVMVNDLQPGMVLANGIYSPHGLLLVGQGQSLSSATITKLRSHNLTTPIQHQLLVYS